MMKAPNDKGSRFSSSGWVGKVRDMGSIKFFLLRNRDGTLQVTAKRGETPEAVMKSIAGLGMEDFVRVGGRLVESRQAGGRELRPESVTVIGKSATPLPFDPSEEIETSLDKRLDWRVFDLRNPRNLAIFKIQSALVQGMQSFLNSHGFLQAFTPCLMGAASESGSEVFPVSYFNKKAYLRQDPQLHRELLIAAGFGKVYDLGPSWRAEKSHTSRHICEHRGLAPEMEVESEADAMRLEEDVVIAGLKSVKKSCAESLALLGKKVDVPEKPFPVLKFPEIYGILESLGKNVPHGEDYDTEAERLLGEWVRKKHRTDFFFVNRFPYKKKPFYVMKAEGEWARSVDMLFRGTEISSGGQREHRHEQLIKQIKEKNMSPESLEWFTRHFKHAAPPMGGFCIGIERFTMKLLDIPNIREAVPFPRAPERLLP